MRQITTKTPKPHSPPRPTQCDKYRQKRHCRALTLDRHNTTDIDKHSKAALSTSTDTIRQLSTKRQSLALTLDRHNTTDNDKNTKAELSPSSDKMRQISTKTPKPHSPPRPTQCDSYRQKRKSRALHLDRHNTTDNDKNTKAALSTSTDTMRHLSTKRQSLTLTLDQHNATVIDKTPKPRTPSTDIMRQIPTKTPKPRSHP